MQNFTILLWALLYWLIARPLHYIFGGNRLTKFRLDTAERAGITEIIELPNFKHTPPAPAVTQPEPPAEKPLHTMLFDIYNAETERLHALPRLKNSGMLAAFGRAEFEAKAGKTYEQFLRDIKKIPKQERITPLVKNDVLIPGDMCLPMIGGLIPGDAELELGWLPVICVADYGYIITGSEPYLFARFNPKFLDMFSTFKTPLRFRRKKPVAYTATEPADFREVYTNLAGERTNNRVIKYKP